MEIKKPSFYMFKHGRALLNREFENVVEEFHYMDLFGFNLNGESCEIEVKVADYDFHKEFTKKSKVEKHSKYLHCVAHKEKSPYWCPTRFYFMVLQNLTTRALTKIDNKGLPYGLIEYNSLSGEITIIRKSKKLTHKKFLGELPIYNKQRDNRHSLTM